MAAVAVVFTSIIITIVLFTQMRFGFQSVLLLLCVWVCYFFYSSLLLFYTSFHRLLMYSAFCCFFFILFRLFSSVVFAFFPDKFSSSPRCCWFFIIFNALSECLRVCLFLYPLLPSKVIIFVAVRRTHRLIHFYIDDICHCYCCLCHACVD